jgi:hypothetical protein
VHGAINLATGAWHHHVSVKNVSVVFCYFLQQLLEPTLTRRPWLCCATTAPLTTVESPGDGWPNTPDCW